MLSATSSSIQCAFEQAGMQQQQQQSVRSTATIKSCGPARSTSLPPVCTMTHASGCSFAPVRWSTAPSSRACSSNVALSLPGSATLTVIQPMWSPKSSGHVRIGSQRHQESPKMTRRTRTSSPAAVARESLLRLLRSSRKAFIAASEGNSAISLSERAMSLPLARSRGMAAAAVGAQKRV